MLPHLTTNHRLRKSSSRSQLRDAPALGLVGSPCSSWSQTGYANRSFGAREACREREPPMIRTRLTTPLTYKRAKRRAASTRAPRAGNWARESAGCADCAVGARPFSSRQCTSGATELPPLPQPRHAQSVEARARGTGKAARPAERYDFYQDAVRNFEVVRPRRKRDGVETRIPTGYASIRPGV